MSKKILAAKDAQRRNGNVTLSKVGVWVYSLRRQAQTDCGLRRQPHCKNDISVVHDGSQ